MNDAPRLFSTADIDFQVLLAALGLLFYLLLVFVAFQKIAQAMGRTRNGAPLDPARERKALYLTIAYIDDELWELRRVGAIGRLNVVGVQRKWELERRREEVRARLLQLEAPTDRPTAVA